MKLTIELGNIRYSVPISRGRLQSRAPEAAALEKSGKGASGRPNSYKPVDALVLHWRCELADRFPDRTSNADPIPVRNARRCGEPGLQHPRQALRNGRRECG